MLPHCTIRAFARDRSGTTAVLFGIASIAILGTAAIAIDLARSYSIRNSLQSALDAAILAAAANMYDQDANLNQTARLYLENNWRDKLGVTGVTVNVNQDASGQLNASASAYVPATIARVLGYEGIPVNVDAQIIAGTRAVEAAFVLDNTASMAGAKMDALKSSARLLVNNVYSGRNADRYATIGIVPFARYVNVGMGNRNKPWMSVPPDTSTPREWCRNEYPVISQSNCRTVTYTGTNDGVPYTGSYQTCDYEYGPPQYICSPYNETHTWYGCAGSRNTPLNVQDDTYSTPIPGIMDVSCPNPITPLTNDKRLLIDQIDALSTTGETYIPSGLVWGWRLLSKEEPFSEAHEYGEIVHGNPIRKLLVLMTDGANTLSLTAPTHDGSDVADANATTQQLCSNIKARGIEVVTIAFGVSDNGIKDILRTCASSSSKFFDATDGDQLEAAFRDIALDMVALHLSR